MTDHEQQPTLEELYSQATWDARYAEADRIWSGNPNPRLVEHVTDLTPGSALDVGAGEGADAVWLASQGWEVTALDVSPVALSKTREHALGAGVEVHTLHHDLLSGAPLPGAYDLVSAQFWHPPAERFEDLRDVLGAAVKPGGTLLIVGHHPTDLDSHGSHEGHGSPGGGPPAAMRAAMFTPERAAALFDADAWDLQTCLAPTRPTNRPTGPPTLTDAVIRLRRRIS